MENENPIPPQKTTPELPHVHTYQSDIAESVKHNNTSVVKIALSEARKRDREETDAFDASAKSPRNMIIIGISVLLLLAGGTTLFFVFAKKAATPSTNATPVLKDLLRVDKTVSVSLPNLDRDSFLFKISDAKNTPIPANSFEAVTFPDKTTPNFLSLLGPNMPGSLARSLNSQFAFGFHAEDTNQPYLIFTTDAYQNAFAGMLAYEGDMLFDIGPIFLSKYSASDYLNTDDNKNAFKDVILQNKDARVVYDANGQIVFLYSFIDSQTLVITTNEQTLAEIENRIRLAKLTK